MPVGVEIGAGTTTNEMAYPVVPASSNLNVAFNYPQALPTTFVFDKTGHRNGKAIVGGIRIDSLAA